VEIFDRERLLVLQIDTLRRLACRLVPDKASAEDLVQDVALTLLEHPNGPVGEASFSLWCESVARHLRMHRRRAYARLVNCLQTFAMVIDEPTLDFERAVLMRDQLAAGVSTLDHESVNLLVERYLDGATSREIAARRQVSAASIRMRLSRLCRIVRSATADPREDHEPAWGSSDSADAPGSGDD
jgi:RNA polymerase sigma factor (sigma-70 family)